MTRILLSTLALSLLLLTSATTAFGQKGHHLPLDQFADQLKLTAEQQAQLEAAKAEFHTARQQLKEQEFETPAERHTAMKALKEQQKSALQEILTEEQLSELKTLRQAAREEHRAAMKNVDRKGLHDALRTHRETNILPVLRQQRTLLEERISADDRRQIAELRQEFAQQREKRKAERSALRETREKGEKTDQPHRRHPRPELTPEEKARKAEVKALVGKYETDIKSLLEEIQPQAEQWEKERQAIKDQFLPEGYGPKKRGHRHGKGHHQRPAMKAAHFLLLDPAATATPAMEDNQLPALDLYPNPSSTVNTIKYSIQKNGQVQIFLTDRSGQVIQQLFDGQQTPGDYTLDVDVSQLQDGVYYYTIQDATGRRTEQFVVKR